MNHRRLAFPEPTQPSVQRLGYPYFAAYLAQEGGTANFAEATCSLLRCNATSLATWCEYEDLTSQIAHD
jgi:hypothetical protein